MVWQDTFNQKPTQPNWNQVQHLIRPLVDHHFSPKFLMLVHGKLWQFFPRTYLCNFLAFILSHYNYFCSFLIQKHIQALSHGNRILKNNRTLQNCEQQTRRMRRDERKKTEVGSCLSIFTDQGLQKSATYQSRPRIQEDSLKFRVLHPVFCIVHKINLTK